MYENKNTPICFPKNKPHNIPSGTGASNELNDMPSKTTPALAKANKGIMPKATYGESMCSNFKSNEKSCWKEKKSRFDG